MATGLKEESMKDYKQVVEERYNNLDKKRISHIYMVDLQKLAE